MLHLFHVDKSKSETRLCFRNLGLHPKKFSSWMTPPRTSSLSGALFFPAMGMTHPPSNELKVQAHPMHTRAALQSASIFQIFLQIRLLWCSRRKRRGERKISGILKQCLFFFAGLWVYVQYICRMGFRTERGTLL